MDPAEPIDEAHQAHRHAAAITAYQIRAAVSSRCCATVSTVCREALPTRAHRGTTRILIFYDKSPYDEDKYRHIL
jgi:hypothetical protein